ncbi:MAG TPA: hypothetical protein VL475_04185 [Planctomycetaceae bacterium]|jgi:hypothetical protein|nr:hypothetical protein [Planctomycetaceae bacterium]
MNLTAEQTQAVTKGEAIRLVPPELAVECVLLRADVYDRVKSLLYDDRPLSEAEKIAALRAAGERAGWDDPELDVYEEYRRKS